MSIKSILDELLEQKRLFKLPSAWGLETPRTMIITPDILAVVSQPFADTDEGVRFGEFRQTLDSFAELSEITVSEDPDNKPPSTVLARVHPLDAEFWSIRVLEPPETDGIRCIGAFVDLNKFVALTSELRENIPVGAFDDEVDEAREKWRDLFGSVHPHSGDSLDDYLTHYYVP